MIKRLLVLSVCAAQLTACASANGLRAQTAGSPYPDARAQAVNRTLLVHYAQKLPLGTRVRVKRLQGDSVTGTLMKVTDQVVVVQRRTRLPEPPDEIPYDQITAIEPQGSNGIAKAIALGAAAGAGAAMTVFLILVAIYAE